MIGKKFLSFFGDVVDKEMVNILPAVEEFDAAKVKEDQQFAHTTLQLGPSTFFYYDSFMKLLASQSGNTPLGYINENTGQFMTEKPEIKKPVQVVDKDDGAIVQQLWLDME